MASVISLSHVCFSLQAGYKDVSRDPQRTPMQWSGKISAGFSTANSTWLPVAEDFPENNVKVKRNLADVNEEEFVLVYRYFKYVLCA